MGAHSRARVRWAGLGSGHASKTSNTGHPVRRAGLAVGITATVGSIGLIGLGGVAQAAPAAASPSQLAALRACESGGNYSTNTGNGYYGAYQFNLSTWHSLGFAGSPAQASAATQDAAVQKLLAQSGWSPWPVCGRGLGAASYTPAVSAPAVSTPSGPTAADAAPTAGATQNGLPVLSPEALAGGDSAPATSYFVPNLKTEKAPALKKGTVYSTKLQDKPVHDVAVWQRRMDARGWNVKVDGYYGPQTAKVAKEFAAEKKLHPKTAGSVDTSVWGAAWTQKVTH